MTASFRLLEPDDAKAFFRLRLEALEQQPFAFSASAETYRTQPLAAVAERLKPIPDVSFTLGAFIEEELVGLAGFVRGSSPKTRHTGFIWGVYVTDRARGHGLGRKLLTNLIERVSAFEGVQQMTLGVSLQ